MRGSIRLENGVLTFSDVHEQSIVTLDIKDIAAVRGHFVIVPGLHGGVVGTGIFESGIRVVQRKTKRPSLLLVGSW